MKRKVAKKTTEKNLKKTKIMEVIDLTSASPIKKKKLNSNDGRALRGVFCLKNKCDMKEVEAKEDCFILDFDNHQNIAIHNKAFADDDDDDLTLVSEIGQVACRDFPHARHLCVKNHFDRTSHDTYCPLCFCFVCDKAAPCSSWSNHCHAIDNEAWKSLRASTRARKIQVTT